MATYSFTKLPNGTYQISATWPAISNAATNTPFSFYDNTKLLSTTTVNQVLAPQATGPNGFQVLATVTVSSGTLNVVINNKANSYVIADAVEITPVASSGAVAAVAPANVSAPATGNASNASNAAATVPFQNPVNPLDVLNTGGPITPADALAVIDYLNTHPNGALPTTPTAGIPYVDVLGTGTVTPADALAVIDYLNTQPVAAAIAPAVAPAVTTAPGVNADSLTPVAAGGSAESNLAPQTQSTGPTVAPTVTPAEVAASQIGGPSTSDPAVQNTTIAASPAGTTQASATPPSADDRQGTTVDLLLSDPVWSWLDE